jgi:hypothetical protein
MTDVIGDMTFFRRRPTGGLDQCERMADADIALVHLPTLDEPRRFDLPADRAALEAFAEGVTHGSKIGRWRTVNDLRAIWGDEPISHPGKVK